MAEQPYARVAYELLLVPAWRATYVYRGTTRTVSINGDSGPVVGDRPRSALRVARISRAGLRGGRVDSTTRRRWGQVAALAARVVSTAQRAGDGGSPVGARGVRSPRSRWKKAREGE